MGVKKNGIEKLKEIKGLLERASEVAETLTNEEMELIGHVFFLGSKISGVLQGVECTLQMNGGE